MAPRTSRKRTILEWDNDSDDEDGDTTPRIISIPHTEVNLGDSGRQSTRTSYISTLASPPKQATNSNTQPIESQYYREGYFDQQETGFDEDHLPDLDLCDESDCDDESDDDLDPAYEQHLDEQEPGPPKPKRRPRV